VRKWTDPQTQVIVQTREEPTGGEKVKRARAFRRWIDTGAEAGGLRALAGDQTHPPTPDVPDREQPRR
jgi:hypothetical protein